MIIMLMIVKQYFKVEGRGQVYDTKTYVLKQGSIIIS